jgi:hypothetical protein
MVVVMLSIILPTGLIVLIAALVVLLYRMGARARQQRELQNRLQTISELLGDIGAPLSVSRCRVACRHHCV